MSRALAFKTVRLELARKPHAVGTRSRGAGDQEAGRRMRRGIDRDAVILDVADESRDRPALACGRELDLGVARPIPVQPLLGQIRETDVARALILRVGPDDELIVTDRDSLLGGEVDRPFGRIVRLEAAAIDQVGRGVRYGIADVATRYRRCARAGGVGERFLLRVEILDIGAEQRRRRDQETRIEFEALDPRSADVLGIVRGSAVLVEADVIDLLVGVRARTRWMMLSAMS